MNKNVVVAMLAVVCVVANACVAIAQEPTKAAPSAALAGITNGCTVTSVGTLGCRLAGHGGAHVNMMDALKLKIAAMPLVRSNVTVRVGFAEEEAKSQTVTFGFGASEGRYVATTDSTVLCEVIDNATARVVKTVRVPARGDITSSAFYEHIADAFVAAMQ